MVINQYSVDVKKLMMHYQQQKNDINSIRQTRRGNSKAFACITAEAEQFLASIFPEKEELLKHMEEKFRELLVNYAPDERMLIRYVDNELEFRLVKVGLFTRMSVKVVGKWELEE